MSEVVMGIGTPGGRNDCIAELGKYGRGDGSNAPGGPGDQHLARCRSESLGLERDHGKHCRKSGSTDGHCLTCGQAGWYRDQPIAVDPCLLRVAAPTDLAHAPARQYHLVAGLVSRMTA